MIEQKLQAAADSLPEPGSDYLAVEERMKKKRSQPQFTPKRHRFLAVLSLVVLLVGCVASTPDYHLYNGNFFSQVLGFYELGEELGRHWNSVESAANELGVTIPKTLGGSPFHSYSKYNLTPQEVPILFAVIAPEYVYQSATYGYDAEEEYATPDGTPGTSHWTEDYVQVTFGSMDDEIWRRQFGYDENDIWVGSNILREAVDSSTLEYEGIILYIATCDYGDWSDHYSNYGQYVHWIDYAHNTAFVIHQYADTPEGAIECAKELIDLNK